MSLFSRVFGGTAEPKPVVISEPHERDAASSLIAFFSVDHRDCDARWVVVENAIDAGDLHGAISSFEAFRAAMLRHLQWEEGSLFPAFEEATGMTAGPTAVMRMEHEQMRGVLRMMVEAVERQDLESLGSQGDTLLMLIQQHNQKEEGMLYPMAERALGDRWPAIRQACLDRG